MDGQCSTMSVRSGSDKLYYSYGIFAIRKPPRVGSDDSMKGICDTGADSGDTEHGDENSKNA